jgi:pimeloyl-ACP methyl ester carboxylesterase
MATASVGSIDLYFEEHGRGDPLLLIMGLGADSQAWTFQVPAFAERYRTIVFDNRGIGRSAKPAGPYTTAEMADDAVGLLRVLDVDRAHVVGVSMGGMIAQELALRHPERVRGLVLASTYPEPDGQIVRQREASVTQLGGTVAADDSVSLDLSTLDPLRIFEHMMPLVFTPSFVETQLSTVMQLAGSVLHDFSMEAIFAQVAAAMSHRTTDRLHRIAAPTLVLTGDADRLIPPAHSDRLAEAIPGARLVKVPGGSHAMNVEVPEAFNRAVLDFLTET